MGYRQAVVLSHMASGRVPIPIDRATDIAREVGLPPKKFLQAVLQQRHPEVEWELLTTPGDPLCAELEILARKPLSSLSEGHQRVVREAVRDPDPEARWLSIPEIPAVKLFRELFPDLSKSGLSASDRATVKTLAELLLDIEKKVEE